MGIEGLLIELAYKMTGKRTTAHTVEGILEFMVKHYQGPSGGSTATHSLPAGGTTGQVLTKKSNTAYDVQWADPK